LFQRTRRQVDRLVVLVADHASHTIHGELRKQWLETIHPDCEIHLVADELENDSAQMHQRFLAHLREGERPFVVLEGREAARRERTRRGMRRVGSVPHYLPLLTAVPSISRWPPAKSDAAPMNARAGSSLPNCAR
jgi:hypothetical protein